MTKKFRDKIKTGKKISTEMGFEPTRAEHIGLAVQRLNHSATQSLWEKGQKFEKQFVLIISEFSHNVCLIWGSGNLHDYSGASA